MDTAAREAAIFRMKHFVVRRASKKYPEDKLPADDPAALRDGVRKFAADAFPELVAPGDDELTFATRARRADRPREGRPGCGRRHRPVRALGGGPPLRAGRARGVAGWVSFHFPHFVDHEDLVPLRRPDPEAADDHRRAARAPAAARRLRARPTPRMRRREVASEVDYCLYCHEREKDSCSKGMHDKTGAVKTNPLGRRRSPAARWTRRSARCTCCGKDGDSIAALAMIIIDNPMLPRHRPPHLQRLHEGLHLPEAGAGQHPAGGDGRAHRRARDAAGASRSTACSRAGTRSTATRPYARPYNGKNVLVVGLGPAGYTLAHHLLNEGFGVVGIDGLKIEPLPAELIGADAWPPRAGRALGRAVDAARRARARRLRRRRRVRHHRALGQELPDRAPPDAGAPRPASASTAASASAAPLDADEAFGDGLRPRRHRRRRGQADASSTSRTT